MIRAFICIELPDDIKEKLGRLQADLKALGQSVRWTRTDGIHLTLKFLGDIEQEVVPNIVEQISEAAQQISPFEIQVKDVGAFPNFKKPRVFWIGIDEQSGALAHIQTAIESNLASLGFEKEQRRFSPHLTIGRVKTSEGLNSISSALEQMKLKVMSFSAKQVVVMQSQLQPTGAVYTPLHVIKIGC